MLLLLNFSLTCPLITRATASMFLEKQLEKTDVTVSWFEQHLTKDGVIPDQPDVLQSRTKKLQVSHLVKQQNSGRSRIFDSYSFSFFSFVFLWSRICRRRFSQKKKN